MKIVDEEASSESFREASRKVQGGKEQHRMWPWKFHTFPPPTQDWNDINTEDGLQLPKHGVLFQPLCEYFLIDLCWNDALCTSLHSTGTSITGLESRRLLVHLTKLILMGNYIIIVLNFKLSLWFVFPPMGCIFTSQFIS